jgi:hypothetical protein
MRDGQTVKGMEKKMEHNQKEKNILSNPMAFLMMMVMMMMMMMNSIFQCCVMHTTIIVILTADFVILFDCVS